MLKRAVKWTAITGAVLLNLVLVAVVVRGIVAGPFHARTDAVAQAAPAPQSTDEKTTLDQLARKDLAALPSLLHFTPMLPTSLPPGFRYVRVPHRGALPGELRAFDIFIAGPDSAQGSRAIHLHEGEGIQGVQGKPSPLEVYGGVARPVVLANGTWYAMQNKDNPYPKTHPYGGGIGGPDAWIFMAQRGGVFIEVDGLVARNTIEAFVASLK